MAADLAPEVTEAEMSEVAAALKRPRHRMGAHLRVEQHGPTARYARVWLNDMDLTAIGGGLMSLEITLPGNGGRTVATLKIGVDELEVDMDTLLALQAIVRDQHGG